MGVKKISISHQRAKCIGCGACVFLAPNNWTMNVHDGRSDLVGGALQKNGMVTATIDEGDEEANKEARDACPVRVIRFH